MLDAPESADADRRAWHAAAAGAWRDLLAALDRHWIGTVWGASVASQAAGLALASPGLVQIGQAPLVVAALTYGTNLLLAAIAQRSVPKGEAAQAASRGTGWQVLWRPPSRWRLRWFRGTVAIHREEALRLVPGTRFWEEIASARVERAGPGVCIGPLEVSRRHPPSWTESVTVARSGEGHDA